MLKYKMNWYNLGKHWESAWFEQIENKGKDIL